MFRPVLPEKSRMLSVSSVILDGIGDSAPHSLQACRNCEYEVATVRVADQVRRNGYRLATSKHTGSDVLGGLIRVGHDTNIRVAVVPGVPVLSVVIGPVFRRGWGQKMV